MRALAGFMAMIVLGFASIAALTYPAWQVLHPSLGVPFHRLGERIGMLVLFATTLVFSSRLGIRDRNDLGYGIPRASFAREMALGLCLGVVTMLACVGCMHALGLLDWAPARLLTTSTLLKLVITRLGSGLAVAFIEETFLRGAMFTAIKRESGASFAVIATSILYATSHFFASFHIPADQVSSSSGLALLTGTLHLLAQPLYIADAFLCLFAVGVALSLVRLATGNIAACVGLHAGWVWVMLVAHELSLPAKSAPLHFLLSRFDGFVGWLVLAWTALLAVFLQNFYRRRRRLSSGRFQSDFQ
jgi:uncharacterized protein